MLKKEAPLFTTPVNAAGIVHPIGYDGTGGLLTITVCTQDQNLKGPLRRAINTWNSLVASVGNCTNCRVAGEGNPASGMYDAESVLVHELGHCAFNLDHPNRRWDFSDGQPPYDMHTSVAAAVNVAQSAAGISIGPDGMEGSHDDAHFQVGQGNAADSISWHRRMDNDPFVIDGTAISAFTYTRSIGAGLPAGHSWGRVAHRLVGNALLVPNTQSVMYSTTARQMTQRSLTADDVNMIKMGNTGSNRVGGDSNDYEVFLSFSENCLVAHEIEVVMGPVEDTPIAQCAPGGFIQRSFAQGSDPVHYTIGVGTDQAAVVTLENNDPEVVWDLGTDGDNDFLPNLVEDAGPNGGDGNGDSTDDSFQNYVASLPSVIDGEYVTLVLPSGASGDATLVDVRGVHPDSQFPSFAALPGNVHLPLGVLSFEIHGTPTLPASIDVDILLPEGMMLPSGYHMFDSGSDEWYAFPQNATPGFAVGVDQITGRNQVTLTLVDGGLGDDDLNPNNNIVVHLGGPIIVTQLDIDGDGEVVPLTDGLLVLRYQFGLTGSALIGGVVDADCTRCTAPGIEAYLAGLGSALDIDDTGSISALTDGLLTLRYLFGLRGSVLITGAVSQTCDRCTFAEIETYLAILD